MMNYIAILTFQIMFNIFKVLEIKFTYENQLSRLLVNSVWINLVSLASVYFSLDSLLKGDMWVLPFYIGGSVLGKWIAMTQMDNLESKLFVFFRSKTEKPKRNAKSIIVFKLLGATTFPMVSAICKTLLSCGSTKLSA